MSTPHFSFLGQRFALFPRFWERYTRYNNGDDDDDDNVNDDEDAATISPLLQFTSLLRLPYVSSTSPPLCLLHASLFWTMFCIFSMMSGALHKVPPRRLRPLTRRVRQEGIFF